MPFEITDWENAANLTDNEAVNKAIQDANDAQGAAESAQTTASQSLSEIAGIHAQIDSELAKESDMQELVANLRNATNSSSFDWCATAYQSAIASASTMGLSTSALDSAFSTLNAASKNSSTAAQDQIAKIADLTAARSALIAAREALAEAGGNDEALQQAVDSAIANVETKVAAYNASLDEFNVSLSAYQDALTIFSIAHAKQMNQNAKASADAIARAAETASKFMTFDDSFLTIGLDSDEYEFVRMQLTNERLQFVDPSGVAMADFGKTDNTWQMNIENANITDMMKFGSFAWIRRENGNMSLKWIGA